MKRYPVALALVAALSLSGCVVLAPNGSNPGTGTDNASKQASLVITSFTANPSSLRAGDQLSLSVEAVSSAGRTLTYTWTVTGGVLSATSGKIVNWTSPTTSGTYTVAVSVTDGIGNQAAGSLNVVVSADGNASVGSPTITQPSQSGGGSNQAAQATWSKVFGIDNFNAFHFTNFNLGWVAQRDGKIKHTTDAGATWTTQFTGTNTLNTIFFADANNGWAGGENGILLRTTNEGKQWTLVDWEGAGLQSIYAIKFKDLAEGLMTSSDGLYRTTDGGNSWIQVSSGTQNRELHYFSNGKAFLVGLDGVSRYEGGVVTKASGIDSRLYYSSAAFPSNANNNLAYISANNSEIGSHPLYKTTDGGSSFDRVTKLNLGTEFVTDFRSGAIAFSSDQNGMIVEDGGNYTETKFYYYTTNDGGQTWKRHMSQATTGLNRLFLFESTRGWATDGSFLFRLSP